MEIFEILVWVAGQFITAAAIWGGIRADIKNLHSRVDGVEIAVRNAHIRLDNHLERRAVER